MESANKNEKEPAVIEVKLKGIEEAQRKADELVKTIQKAKTLADELASSDFEINFLDQ